MVESPKVSVIMAVRDGQRWLHEAIDSVLAQTLSDLELVVVDDGSSDATPQILADYVARDPRVRVIRQSADGLVAALNRGLAVARAPLIARLDADDIAMPERLLRQARYLHDHPLVMLLGSWAERIDDASRPKGRLTPALDHAQLFRILAKTNPFIHSSVMFRAAIIRDLGGYRLAFEAAEDYDLWLRIAEIGQVAILPDLLVRCRWHAANVTQVKALRQAFSVRLAKRAGQARRASGRDPAMFLTGPPDWHSKDADTAFYAEDARIFRILELADLIHLKSADLSHINLVDFYRLMPQLTHNERKLAQLAVRNMLLCRERPAFMSTAGLLGALIRLHPVRALRLGWSLLSHQPTG